MDALGRPDVEPTAASGERLNVIGPDAGAVDDDPGADLDPVARLDVLDGRTDDPLPGLGETDDAGGVEDGRAIRRCGAGEHERVPRVVRLRVVVEQGTCEGVLAHGRDKPQGAIAGELAMTRNRPGATHVVVQRQAGGHIRPLPGTVGQRIEERNRPHEVRGEPGQGQFPLLERLTHEAEVHLLEIAQPAVHEFARPGGRAGRVVALLDESDGQATGRRIQCGSGAGDSAADDEDIELAGREAPPGTRAVAGIERDSLRHTAIVPALGGASRLRSGPTTRRRSPR